MEDVTNIVKTLRGMNVRTVRADDLPCGCLETTLALTDAVTVADAGLVLRHDCRFSAHHLEEFDAGHGE
jgi:hypothetical protein